MVLQSPRYDNAGNGERFLLPVANDSHVGTSLAEILTLTKGKNAILDFAQLREVITLVGFLTQQASVDAGLANPVHFRDRIRRVRSVWPTEDGTLTGANWGTGTLPAAEQDAGTTRGVGKARLIYDKRWDTGTGSLVNFFVYGTVLGFQFGPRAAASGRVRIPYQVQFGIGTVASGA